MTTYIKILKYVKPYWLHLSLSVICTILFAVSNGATIFLIMPLMDTLFRGGGAKELAAKTVTENSSYVPGFATKIIEDVKTSFMDYIFAGSIEEILFRVCGLILTAFFLKSFFGYMQSFFLAYVEQNFVKDIRDDAYTHLHKLPMSYFKNEQTGELISRITNDVQVAHSVSAVFLNLIREPITIIVFLGMALAISWKLTLFAFFTVPVSLLVIMTVGRALRRYSKKLQEKIADITTILEETINGVKIVKAFGTEQFENNKFLKETKTYSKIVLKMVRVRNIASPFSEFLGAGIAAVAIFYGGHLVLIEKSLSASAFLGFLFAIFSMQRPIKELTTVNNRIQEASAAADRIFEITETEPAIKDAENPFEIESFEKEIVFENVKFHYDDSTELVLNGINIKVKKGEIVALVGSSGAGKTTLIDLIPRFYDPTNGSILIDGSNIKDIKIENLRKLMGIVTQETILFNETIKNNIAYGISNCPQEEIERVAKIANADLFVKEMPDGYDTVVGDRGTKLSGGQRQRLSIARALLKNPPIMIFDEATSALDNESEVLVQEAIEKLMADRTTFVIAHRLSTIQNADKILVLDEGKIVQVGKHSELLRDENGLYKKLYELQFRD